MEFILWTIWIIAIAVAVNVVMEKVWGRIAEHEQPRDDRGSATLLPRHRSGR